MPAKPKATPKPAPKMPRASRKPAPKVDESMLVDAITLARVFGVNRSRVYQFVNEGMPKAGLDAYDLPTCVKWRVHRASTQLRGAGDIANELKRSTKTKIDLQIAQMRGELLPRGLVEQIMLRLMTMAASQLESLPPRVAADLVGMATPVEIQHHLMVECRATRDLLAAEVTAAASELRHQRGVDSTEDDSTSDLEEAVEADG